MQKKLVGKNWDAIVGGHRVHCYLELVCEGNVAYQGDHATDHYESVLDPQGQPGPSHVIYLPDRVEVCRYFYGGTRPEPVARFTWEDPELLTKVHEAATQPVADLAPLS